MKSKFKVPKFKKNATYGDLYEPAMRVKTKKDAEAYLMALVDHAMKQEAEKPRKEERRSRDAIVNIIKSNIGYWTGYYDGETAARVQGLFGAVHPIFGATRPTQEEALKKGMELGRKAKQCQTKRS